MHTHTSTLCLFSSTFVIRSSNSSSSAFETIDVASCPLLVRVCLFDFLLVQHCIFGRVSVAMIDFGMRVFNSDASATYF